MSRQTGPVTKAELLGLVSDAPALSPKTKDSIKNPVTKDELLKLADSSDPNILPQDTKKQFWGRIGQDLESLGPHIKSGLQKAGQFIEGIPLGYAQSQMDVMPQGATAPVMGGFMPVPRTGFNIGPKPPAPTPLYHANIAQELGVNQTPFTKAGEFAGTWGPLALGGLSLLEHGLKSAAKGGISAFKKLHEGYVPPPTPVMPSEEISPDLMSSIGNQNKMNNHADNIAQQAIRTIPFQYKNDVNGVAENLGSVPEMFTEYHRTHKNIASQLFNAKKPHDEKVPDFLSGPSSSIDITKPLIQNDGSRILPNQLSFIKKNNPRLFSNLEAQYGKTVKSPFGNWMGADYDIGKDFGGKAFKDAEKNPSIKNNHELAQKIMKTAASADPSAKTQAAFELARRIRKEGVQNPLTHFDTITGTHTSIPYSQAHEYWMNNVLPFRADKELHQISTGNKNNASMKSILQALDRANSKIKSVGTDPETGMELPVVPQNHILKTKYPGIERLSKYEATTPLGNLSHGTYKGNIDNLYKLLDDSATNRILDPGHPLLDHLPDLERTIALRDGAAQTATDQQLLSKAKHAQNVEKYKQAMDDYKTTSKDAERKFKLQPRNIAKYLAKEAIKHKLITAAGIVGLSHLF